MRNFILGLTCSSAMVLGSSALSGLCQTNETSSFAVQAEPPSEEHFVSMLHLIGSLAAERFAEDQARGETWIFGVHSGSYIRKYSDGKRMVVLLPGANRYDMSATATYASSYNAGQLNQCRRLAHEGKHIEALEVCRLIAHFGPRDAIQTHRAKLSIPLLEKLTRGEAVKQIREQLDDIILSGVTRHDFRGVRLGKPEIVEDLLKVEVDR